jgi:hypothetical protein
LTLSLYVRYGWVIDRFLLKRIAVEGGEKLAKSHYQFKKRQKELEKKKKKELKRQRKIDQKKDDAEEISDPSAM